MPRILIKRINSPNTPLNLSQLELGELGINYADGRIYLRRGTGALSDQIVDIGDPIPRLGYKPVSTSGDTMTGTLELAPGTSTTPPIKFQQGSVTGLAQPHAFEWDGARLYVTNNGAQRKTIAFVGDSSTGSSGSWSPGITMAWSGDVSGSSFVNGASNLNIPLTLADVNSNVGSFGGADRAVSLTVNSKGLVTAVSDRPIAITTDAVSEGSKLFFTEGRARAAISVEGKLSYDQATGVIGFEVDISDVGESGEFDDLLNSPFIMTNKLSAGGASIELGRIDNKKFIGGKILLAVEEPSTANVHMIESNFINVNEEKTLYTEYSVMYTDFTLANISIINDSASDITIITANPTSTVGKKISSTITLIRRA